MTLVFLFTLAIGNVLAAVIDLTPSSAISIDNKKWKAVDVAYASRNGSTLTVGTAGVPTGGGNTYIVFNVASPSTIEAKFTNISTSGYTDKTVSCGKVSSDQWTAITTACSGNSQYQLSIASGDKLTDQTITLPKSQKDATTSCTFTASAAGKYAIFWASGINNNVLLYEIEITESSTPTCTSPEIAWSTQPAGGAVGDADFVASVTTTPAEQTVTWTSSVPAAATVSNGTIHYVAPGFTKISAEFTYSGSDYCEEKVSVNKDIVVPISTDATGENDKYWYYTTAVPSGSPDNGLNYSGTKSGAGMYGTKLNSDGYAWFVKPAVAGTLRVGAFKSDGSGSNYAVEVYACDDEGTISGDALGTLTTPHAGGVSVSMDIAADVEGIRIKRSTNSEGILYFVEFKAAASACAATVPGDISKGDLTAGEITLTAAGSAEEGDTWYWQNAENGEEKGTYGSGATKNVSAPATWYIRSYNTAANCWSAAKSIEVTAEDFLAHYAITYNKGAYGTGEIAGGEKVEGVAYTLSSDRFTRAGYVQTGWSLTDGGAKAYDLGGSYTTDAAQEFFPVWAETSTYVASFACGATAPAGWTFSNAGTYGDTDATADYVCNFVTAGTSTPKQDPAEGKDGTTDNDVAFAKNTNAIATYDLGAATTVTALNVTLCGGSGSAFNETIEYLGADGSTVKKTYINSLSAGNWNDNLISKNEIVEDVRYIRVHGASKWVAMKAFSVTYVDLVTKYNVTFAKNGGSGADMATLKYAENAVVTLPSCSFTPPDDHVFDGWAVTKTASGDPITVTDGKFTMPAEAVTATAQWATISDFDVKFFQGYGDPDVQIGTTQVISTGNYATAPADPTREGYNFKGWSYDATEEHIVNVAEYAITTATNFTAIWKQVFIVTFDGAGSVNVESGSKVASPDSPTQAGNVFQGWYNGESKYDFSAAVTGNLALESKWAAADPNHFYYTYNDDFHFDGVVYKTPEGKTTDPEAAEATINLTTPYTVYSGAEGITSIVATNGIYDYKKGADTKHVTAYLKLKRNDATSNLAFTIKSGYTAVLNIKMGGYSNNPVVTLKKGDDAVPATSGTIGGTATGKNYNEITYDLTAGTYVMTSADQTLYISHIDLEATALPTHSVTYKPGDGEGAWVVDADATEVADCPGTFTAPTGKVFNGWKNESDDSDVAVGAIVEDDMNLIAQWINVYTVTFNKNGHGDDIDPQDVKEGAKAAKPADPSESGWIFGGWFTDNSTFEAPFDFNTPITAATPLYAKWTEDPCPAPFSLSKVVLTSATDGTVTGYNGNEYAGEKVIGGLKDDGKTADITGDAAVEKGYKLNSGGNSIVFATLKKGEFQEGDRVTVGVIYRNDSRTVDEATTILTIYAGSDKDHTMEIATLTGVSDPGFYTYRLTAADVAAINAAGYKGIGVFRASSNGENHNIYSVEIQGCRSWAVSHQVTYNMMGHGTQVDPQSVPEGDLLTKPTVVEPEGWAFVGWYKENTLENEWDFTTDVMGTSDMTLYAKWEDETSAIKLIVDDATPGSKKINDEAYYTGSPLTSVTISEVVTPCVKLAGGAAAATAPYSADKNDNRVIAYCAQTTQTKIRVIAYSNTNNPRPYTISFVEEGQTADEADDDNVIVNLPTDGTIHTSDWYQFNSSKNRTIYITIPGNASNYHFLQVKVIESGTPIKKAGDLGYSMNFNIGRPIGVKQTLHKNFEGFDFYANNDYKVLQSTSMVISNATNDYIKFHAAAPMTLAVTTENAASFYVTKAAKGTDNETLSTEGGISYIDLDEAADWYISPKGGDLKIQKIEFIAPKCEQPTVVDMENIGLCEGDAFMALTVSASVTDGGTLHYQWYKHPAAGDDETVGTDAASYTPEADGQYYVVVTNQKENFSDNAATSNTITVEHFASAVITTAPLNKRGEVDDVVTLSVAATGKNLSYEWFTCDEDGSTEQAIVPAETGTSLNVTVTAGMAQWYKVKVYSDCGNTEAMAKVSVFVPTTPANVTTSILWDWKDAAWPASGTAAFTNEDAPDYELLADADAIVPNVEGFRSDMLYGKGQYVWRSDNKFFQGTAIKFTSTVAGKVRVYFRSTGSGKTVNVAINGTAAGSRTNSFGWSEYVEVPAGDVEILCTGNGYTRIQQIEFFALAHQRTSGYNVGDLGTVCLEDATFIEGASLYELQGLDEHGYLAFDEISTGKLEAGKPYLFEVINPNKISFYKPIGAAHSDIEIETNGMIGTFAGTTLDQGAENYYYFSGRHIWRVNDFTVSIAIPAHRCYVDMDELQPVAAAAPAPGRRRVTLGVQGTQVVTGIDNLNAGDQPVKVMIDGQMYILRGEKMYDATGRLVK